MHKVQTTESPVTCIISQHLSFQQQAVSWRALYLLCHPQKYRVQHAKPAEELTEPLKEEQGQEPVLQYQKYRVVLSVLQDLLQVKNESQQTKGKKAPGSEVAAGCFLQEHSNTIYFFGARDEVTFCTA